MNFSKLKKSNNFDSLLKEVEKLTNPATFEEEGAERYWKPTLDKAGNGLAVIRFLPGPAVDGDDALPFVRFWDHGFQSKVTGKWYIEKSLTSLGQKDPLAEYNSKLWNSSTDPDSPERKQASDQKRRLHYVSNIEVVDDPKNPQNNGRVFLFKYGKKIMDKVTARMNPDLESEPKINPFDLWKGAPFKLKVTRQLVPQGGRKVPMPNYDESVFLAPCSIRDNDEEIEAIWKSEYSLLEIVAPDKFKTYDQLKARLDEVLGLEEEVRPVQRYTKSPGVSTKEPMHYPINSKEVDEVMGTNDDETPPWNEGSTEEVDDDLERFRKLAME